MPKRKSGPPPAHAPCTNAKSYLGNRCVGEVCRTYVSGLKTKGVIFETYRTSGVSSTGFIGDSNTGLMNMTVFSELKPWYFSATQLTEKHNAAVWHYLWSFSSNPPLIRGTSNQAASAKTSDSRISPLMNGTKKLVHDQGAYSKEPSDDNFTAANR